MSGKVAIVITGYVVVSMGLAVSGCVQTLERAPSQYEKEQENNKKIVDFFNGLYTIKPTPGVNCWYSGKERACDI